jgi:transposase InsO family protein
VEALLRKRLGSKPAASYSFAASEVLRLCDFKLHRAQVRRWAMEHGLAHPRPNRRATAPIRRWQRSQIGELWQLDATPHRWFPGCTQAFPMLNMLDDCSRVFTGSKVYQSENLLAYFDFLPAAFVENGLPLEIYVDYHSLFFTHDPKALTQLGQALHFYGITFRYAPTPQAKGKIERAHFFWQERLPAYFASEAVTDLGQADPHLQALRRHRNHHEVHRELKMTPQRAWELAHKENRSVLRPKPNCPWWPFVWSLRTPIRVGPDGRVPVGSQLLRVEAAPGSKALLCTHPSGHHSVLAASPSQKTKPVILFSNLPK